MNSFKYKISLRVYETSCNPSDITKLLGYDEFRSRKLGEKDLYYWVAQLVDNSSEKKLGCCLENLLGEFVQKSKEFLYLNSHSKQIMLIIATFTSKHHGFVLSSDLVKVFGGLNIDIGFEIYP